MFETSKVDFCVYMFVQLWNSTKVGNFFKLREVFKDIFYENFVYTIQELHPGYEEADTCDTHVAKQYWGHMIL